MKQALNICLILSLCAFTTETHAQSIFGVKAGVQLDKVTGFETNPDHFLASFQLKGVAICPLGDQIFLVPSLGYSGKGYSFSNVEFTDPSGNYVGNGTANGIFHYVQLSLPFSYKFTLDPKKDLYFGLGPYFSYAVAGTGKIKNVAVPASDKTWNLFKDDVYKKPDAGVVVEFNSSINKKFLVAVNVDVGLANISNDGGNRLKQLAAGLSLGYLFAK
jgi:hypothetical protein